MRDDLLFSALKMIVERLKIKSSEREEILREIEACFSPPEKEAWSEERRKIAAEKRKTQWAKNRVEAVFKINFRNYSPLEVSGYDELAKAVHLTPAYARQKIYRGGGKFTGKDENGYIYTVERVSRATYRGSSAVGDIK